MEERGFTLIELLVVIAIIGILATLVLVSLGDAREKARRARIRSDVRQLYSLAHIHEQDQFTFTDIDQCIIFDQSFCRGGIEEEVTALNNDWASLGAGNIDVTWNDDPYHLCVAIRYTASVATDGYRIYDGVADEGNSSCS